MVQALTGDFYDEWGDSQTIFSDVLLQPVLKSNGKDSVKYFLIKFFYKKNLLFWRKIYLRLFFSPHTRHFSGMIGVNGGIP